MSESFDLVILGGGCAGLSLSMALAKRDAVCPRTLVIEARNEYSNDRTWCFWSDASAPVHYPVQHRWQTMRVTRAGDSVSLDCGSTPYEMVSADDFYSAAQASIDRQPNITLRLGTTVVGEPRHNGAVWRITTSSGAVVARTVVDTRPPKLPRLDGATLWQSFYGKEIECSSAIFDPLSLDLMDFLEPDPRHVPFVYVLPVTATRALVEVTVFGARPLAPGDLSAQLDAAISERVRGASFTTLRSEHGILPMGLTGAPEPVHHSYARIGVMAGSARPSTGYAFQRIQRWADECAQALATSGQPIGHRRDPSPLHLMDQIFLEVLRAEPLRGADVFFSLFSRADPARIIRFLSGKACVADSLAVMAAMPVKPFATAALAMTQRLRSARGTQTAA